MGTMVAMTHLRHHLRAPVVHVVPTGHTHRRPRQGAVGHPWLYHLLAALPPHLVVHPQARHLMVVRLRPPGPKAPDQLVHTFPLLASTSMVGGSIPTTTLRWMAMK